MGRGWVLVLGVVAHAHCTRTEFGIKDSTKLVSEFDQWLRLLRDHITRSMCFDRHPRFNFDFLSRTRH